MAIFFAGSNAIRLRLAQFSPRHLDRLIKDCAELHSAKSGSAADPFETGSAAPAGFSELLRLPTSSRTSYATKSIHGEAS